MGYRTVGGGRFEKSGYEDFDDAVYDVSTTGEGLAGTKKEEARKKVLRDQIAKNALEVDRLRAVQAQREAQTQVMQDQQAAYPGQTPQPMYPQQYQQQAPMPPQYYPQYQQPYPQYAPSYQDQTPVPVDQLYPEDAQVEGWGSVVAAAINPVAGGAYALSKKGGGGLGGSTSSRLVKLKAAAKKQNKVLAALKAQELKDQAYEQAAAQLPAAQQPGMVQQFPAYDSYGPPGGQAYQEQMQYSPYGPQYPQYPQQYQEAPPVTPVPIETTDPFRQSMEKKTSDDEAYGPTTFDVSPGVKAEPDFEASVKDDKGSPFGGYILKKATPSMKVYKSKRTWASALSTPRNEWYDKRPKGRKPEWYEKQKWSPLGGVLDAISEVMSSRGEIFQTATEKLAQIQLPAITVKHETPSVDTAISAAQKSLPTVAVVAGLGLLAYLFLRK